MTYTEKDLTPWFPPGVNPVRVGEYNASGVRSHNELRWWDGVAWSYPYWYWDYEGIRKVQRMFKVPSTSLIWWRGLTADPGAGDQS